MKQHDDGWPELTYRYIEHYAWEPQHLLLRPRDLARLRGQARIKEVYRRLRHEEVPLNYLLNVLLRLVPSTIRRECLKPFGIGQSDAGLASLTLRTPWDYKNIQPDVHLESATARVFIEAKVDARLTLEQIKKYVTLHTDLDEKGGVKQHYVLFLVKSRSLRITDIKQSFDHESTGSAIPALLDANDGGITFGSTSWSKFGQTLQDELERRRKQEDESNEMLATLIGDFLIDLKTRGLLPEQSA
ncbi:protein of unknown function [Candidatus Promineifilum breve]|uniref:Uncharacterized protein n=1 Tax=Candidatus Promineifilum breve TaxID=1806508 RepID=A0A160T3U6_9CHLR|nr:PD-(D/E)XK nuclease family protein [Candidatus Promineifilum breve]CUS04891.2 protein of unknown function [Candidatus Promineifilum breve]